MFTLFYKITDEILVFKSDFTYDIIEFSEELSDKGTSWVVIDNAGGTSPSHPNYEPGDESEVVTWFGQSNGSELPAWYKS